MQSIKDIPAKQLMPGITGYYAHGSSMTFGYIEIKKGTKMAEHSHPHEQITYILEGQLEMLIGGEKMLLIEGAVHVIPSNVVHGAFAVTNCTIIDVFSPVREDYKPKDS